MSGPVKRLLVVLVLLAFTVDARPPSIKRGTYRYDPDSIPQNERILRLFLHLAAHTANRLIFLKNDARSKLPNRGHESAANNRRIPPSNNVADEPSVRLFVENVRNGNESSSGNEGKVFDSNQTSGNESTASPNVKETLNLTTSPKNGVNQDFVPDSTTLNESRYPQVTTTEESKSINNGDDSDTQVDKTNANFGHNVTVVKNPSTPVAAGSESEPKEEVVEKESSSVNQQANSGHDGNQKGQTSKPENNQDYQKNVQENVNHSNTLPKETSVIQFGMSVTSTRNQEAPAPVLHRRKGLLEGTSDLLSKTIDTLGQPRKIVGTIGSGLKTILPLGKKEAKEAGNRQIPDVDEDQMEIASRLFFGDDKAGSQNGGNPRVADSVTEPKLTNPATLVPAEPIAQQIPGSNILGNNATETESVLSKVPSPSVIGGLLDNSGTQNRPEVRLYQNKVSQAVETILSPVTTTLDEATAKITKDTVPTNKIESVVPLFRAFPEVDGQSKVSDSGATPRSDTGDTKTGDEARESQKFPVDTPNSSAQDLKSSTFASAEKILPSKISSNLPDTIGKIGKLVTDVNEPKSMIPMFRAFPDLETSQHHGSTTPKGTKEKQTADEPATHRDKNNNRDRTVNYTATEHLRKCDDTYFANRPTAIPNQFYAENSAIELKESLPFSGEVHLDDDLNGSISESALRDISDRLFTVLQSTNEEKIKNGLDHGTAVSPTNKVETFKR